MRTRGPGRGTGDQAYRLGPEAAPTHRRPRSQTTARRPATQPTDVDDPPDTEAAPAGQNPVAKVSLRGQSRATSDTARSPPADASGKGRSSRSAHVNYRRSPRTQAKGVHGNPRPSSRTWDRAPKLALRSLATLCAAHRQTAKLADRASGATFHKSQTKDDSTRRGPLIGAAPRRPQAKGERRRPRVDPTDRGPQFTNHKSRMISTAGTNRSRAQPAAQTRRPEAAPALQSPHSTNHKSRMIPHAGCDRPGSAIREHCRPSQSTSHKPKMISPSRRRNPRITSHKPKMNARSRQRDARSRTRMHCRMSHSTNHKSRMISHICTLRDAARGRRGEESGALHLPRLRLHGRALRLLPGGPPELLAELVQLLPEPPVVPEEELLQGRLVPEPAYLRGRGKMQSARAGPVNVARGPWRDGGGGAAPSLAHPRMRRPQTKDAYAPRRSTPAIHIAHATPPGQNHKPNSTVLKSLPRAAAAYHNPQSINQQQHRCPNNTTHPSPINSQLQNTKIKPLGTMPNATAPR